MNSNHPLDQKKVGQGKNALAIRHQNELAALNYIRTHKEASRLDLAQALGVTSQAIATISHHLVESRLIKKVRKHYTKIAGQPPTIYQLDSEGAYSIGISIGRSHSDIILVDFCGGIVQRKHLDYDYPDPDEILDYTEKTCKDLIAFLDKEKNSKPIGIGMSMPYYFHLWDQEFNYPEKVMKKWETYNMHKLITERLGMPIILEKDTSASAIGEVLFGNKHSLDSFVYIYIGTFPGGSLIMNGKLLHGHSSNAGSIGSMLIPASNLVADGNADASSKMVQLLQRAGLYSLRKYLEQQAIHFKGYSELYEALENDKNIHNHVNTWIDDAAEAIAYVTVSTNALLDFKAIIIDGAMPDFWIKKIIERSSYYYDQLENRGIIKPEFHQGDHHADARSLGSAALPLYNIFFKDNAL